MRGRKHSASDTATECPNRVKLGNTQREQMTSAVHPTTDIAKILRHFRFVPRITDMQGLLQHVADNDELPP